MTQLSHSVPTLPHLTAPTLPISAIFVTFESIVYKFVSIIDFLSQFFYWTWACKADHINQYVMYRWFVRRQHLVIMLHVSVISGVAQLSLRPNSPKPPLLSTFFPAILNSHTHIIPKLCQDFIIRWSPISWKFYPFGFDQRGLFYQLII